ncbi:cytochrome P450 [Enterovirga sp.]|uniref:cytochrome P450 n=1 Tax=Enterovirga sp. TaxID=2026350 RepID=UPI0026261BBD|nr:cytochrome P450 [Enterovirga sp.]MDB5591077.1 Cytochrome [Enterovirga sp.]
MSAFVPPFPPRAAKPLSTFQVIRRARRNLLEIFGERAFEIQLSVTRVLARRIFICNAPDLVQYAFSSRNAAFERKSPQMRHALEPLLGDGLFVSDGETWRRRRKLVGPVIHTNKIGLFAPIMVDTILEARERWAALPEGAEVDALSQMAELTAEIICRTIFGRQLGASHAREVVEGFSDYQRHVGQTDALSLLGLPDWLPRWHGPALHRSKARIHAVLDGIIADYRRRGASGETSVIGHLLDARDAETGAPLADEALRNEAAVIFMAGHETTANTLAWAWFLLSQAPDVEAKLHEELDSVLGGEAPSLRDVARLPYTRAVIEETLRLYPPVPILAREALEDETIRGRPVPKGSLVMVVPWLLHRHKQLWAEPDNFTPERFLPGSPEPVSKFAYVPFSIGPRICAGLSFGMTESILSLATLAQRFTLRLKPGHDVQPVCRLTLRPGETLPMFVMPRRPAATPAGPAAGPEAAAPACPFGHA